MSTARSDPAPDRAPATSPGPPGCASRCCTSCCSAALLFARRPRARRRAPTIRASSSSTPPSTRRRSTLSRPRAAASPNAEELDALRRAWLDNEVLYREGLALQVDQGDTAIRDRVIFKALSVVDAERQAAAGRRRRCCARGSRSTARSTTSRRATTSRRPCWPATASEAAVARLRRRAERRHAGRRRGRPARLQGPAARQPRAELRRRASPRRSRRRRPGEWRALRTRDGWRAMRLDAVDAAAKPRRLRRAARRRAAGLDRRHDGRAAHRGRARAGEEVHGQATRCAAPMSRRAAHAWLRAGLLALLAAPAARGARDEHGRDGGARDRAAASSSGSGRPAATARRGDELTPRLARGLPRRGRTCCAAARPASRGTLAIEGVGKRYSAAMVKVLLARRPVARLHADRGAADGAAVRLGRRPARHGRDRAAYTRARHRAHPDRLRPPAVRDRRCCSWSASTAGWCGPSPRSRWRTA